MYQVGLAYQYNDDFDNAISYYIESISQYDGAAIVWSNLGCIYTDLERYKEAIEALTTAIEKAQTDDLALISAYIPLIQIHMYITKDTDEAARLIERFFEISLMNYQYGSADFFNEFIEQVEEYQPEMIDLFWKYYEQELNDRRKITDKLDHIFNPGNMGVDTNPND